MKCRSSVDNHSWSEFMSVIAIPCPDDSISQNSTPQLPAYIPSASSSMMFSKPWWGRMGENKDDQIWA